MGTAKADALVEDQETRIPSGMNRSAISAGAVLLILTILSITVPPIALTLWEFWVGGY